MTIKQLAVGLIISTVLILGLIFLIMSGGCASPPIAELPELVAPQANKTDQLTPAEKAFEETRLSVLKEIYQLPYDMAYLVETRPGESVTQYNMRHRALESLYDDGLVRQDIFASPECLRDKIYYRLTNRGYKLCLKLFG